VTFTTPIWLILIVPLVAFMWRWLMPSRLLQVIRGLALLLVVLAIAGAAILWPAQEGMVIVVADRSHSMPKDADETHLQVIQLISESMPANSKLGVLTFAGTTAIEHAPQSGPLDQFTHVLDRDASDLHTALNRAVSLIPDHVPGRILLLSDGQYTHQTPTRAASRAAARGVAIDYRSMHRRTTHDLAIERIDAPTEVSPGESYLITLWLESPVSGLIRYKLARNGHTLFAGEKQIRAGRSRLTFRDHANHSGVIRYDLTVTATKPEQDPVPENNHGKVLVAVEGPRAILCVTESKPPHLVNLLSQAGLQVTTKHPSDCDWSIESLANYACVLVENIRADQLTVHGMTQLAPWVTQTGSGLVITGGQRSYARGGYYKSPLDKILPVSMELRREHRKLRIAMVVALDRSGSMIASAGAGQTKMDLANLGAAEALNMLSPMDEFGCLAVDSKAHLITDLAVLGNRKNQIRNQVLSIGSAGGGIFIYEALAHAVKLLQKAESETRHIILFSDARDSEEPGEYQKLLEACRKANITVSVIGLGTAGDVDAALLKDIAHRGDGRVFFTDRAQDLPRLFAQDTFVVARSTFIDEVTSIQSTAGLFSIMGRTLDPPPAIGGYNLCYIKPSATLAMISKDEYQAPIVSSWQAGLGRVLCYAGEADGKFTGPIGQWPHIGTLLSSLTQWAARRPSVLPDHLLLTQKVQSGICQIQLHIDPEWIHPNQAVRGIPTVTTLRGKPGSEPIVDRSAMRWTSPETLEVQIPLRGQDTALSTVQIPGHGAISLPPVCLVYSPEYQPADPTRSQKTLASLAKMTGGTERVDVAGIWQDLPIRPHRFLLSPWLLFIAIAVLLLEVLERRTGWIGAMVPARQSAPAHQIAMNKSSEEHPATKQQRSPKPTAQSTQQSAARLTAHKQPIDPKEAGGVTSALAQAKQRAQDRTKR